ncbi:MAG: hypothetical protein AAF211_29225, partial [Myxococcota bacterium]
MRTVMGATTVALAVWFGGCVIEDPGSGTDRGEPEPAGDGIVEISWLVGSGGCDLAGVSDVQIQIGTFDETIACDAGATRVQLPAGDYSLVVTGLDADAVARFEAREDLVSIFEDETTILPTLRLSALPSNLTLFWRF